MKSTTSSRITLLVVSVVVASQLAVAQEEKQPSPDDEIQKLLVERRDTLRQFLAAVETNYKSGNATFADMVDAHNRILGAELEVAATKGERVKLRATQVALMQELEKTANERVSAGIITSDRALLAKAARQQAEIDLLREQAHSD